MQDYTIISFNPSIRQYIVEDDDGVQQSITYEDNRIVITEGDTIIQTINYIIETDPGPDDPGPGSSSSDPVSPVATATDGCNWTPEMWERLKILLRQNNTFLEQIYTELTNISEQLGDDSDYDFSGMYNLIVDIRNALQDIEANPSPDYTHKLEVISNQLANIWGDLDTIKTSLSAVQTNTATTNQKLDTVHADLQAVLAELQTQRGILSQILSVLRDMLGHITSIDSNVEELANEEDSQSFFDSFILKFHFIGDIFSIIRQLFADITNDAATVTFVNNGDLPIGDLTSQHFPVSGSPVPVGTAPQVLIKFPSDTYHGADLSGYSAIDMSWYAPYKSRVDSLISGFLWIGYLWLLFKRAPGIMRGAAMIEETNYKIEDWRIKHDCYHCWAYLCPGGYPLYYVTPNHHHQCSRCPGQFSLFLHPSWVLLLACWYRFRYTLHHAGALPVPAADCHCESCLGVASLGLIFQKSGSLRA